MIPDETLISSWNSMRNSIWIVRELSMDHEFTLDVQTAPEAP